MPEHALRTLICLIGFMAGLLAPPSGQAAQGCDDLGGLPIRLGVTWPEVFRALTEQSSCTQNCHVGNDAEAIGLDLSSERLAIFFLVNQSSTNNNAVLRVAPGNPRASLFFQKVNCSLPDVGGPMPPPNGHLSFELQGLIYDWIEQGALGEGPEDPIAREFIFRDSLESLRR